MKLKYKHQDFQDAAVNAAVDLFAGQEKKTGTFSIVRDDGDLFARTELGIGNAPKIYWTISEQDALDLLTIASLLHRRLDGAIRTPIMQ